VKKAESQSVDLYLEVVKMALTGALNEDNDQILGGRRGEGTWKHRIANRMADIVGLFDIEMARKRPYDPALRARGLDRPGRAESMIGLQRMDNLRFCIESVLRDDIPGDLIEAGVWRGGATIFMRAALKAHGDTSRTVWVADSFEGLPAPNVSRYPADRGDAHHTVSELRVGVEQVKHNFRRYGLMDDQVKFLVGWFKDTLPSAPIDRIAVMRLDGDMYESTIQALEALYPKLSVAGYCIIDDYGLLPGAKRAVHDYRTAMGIGDEIVDIDGVGVFWRKTSEVMPGDAHAGHGSAEADT
jgi:O-methyltransferase